MLRLLLCLLFAVPSASAGPFGLPTPGAAPAAGGGMYCTMALAGVQNACEFAKPGIPLDRMQFGLADAKSKLPNAQEMCASKYEKAELEKAAACITQLETAIATETAATEARRASTPQGVDALKADPKFQSELKTWRAAEDARGPACEKAEQARKLHLADEESLTISCQVDTRSAGEARMRVQIIMDDHGVDMKSGHDLGLW